MQKKIKSIILIWLFLGLGIFLFTKQDADISQKISVDDVVQKYLKAIGGEENLKKVNSKRVKYRVFMQTMGGYLMERSIKRGAYVKSGRENSSRYTLYDGKRVWRINGDKKKELKGNILSEFRILGDLDGPFVEYKKKGIAIKYIGKEKVEFSEFLKLEVSYKSGLKKTFYFDKKSGLLKMEKKPGFKYINGKMERGLDTITYYYKYKTVNGIKYPFYWIQTNAELEHMHMFSVEEITIN